MFFHKKLLEGDNVARGCLTLSTYVHLKTDKVLEKTEYKL